MAFVGGFGASKPADDETRGIFETAEIRDGLTSMLGYTVDSLAISEYKTQVVAGVNYLIKCQVNGSKDVVFKAFRGLPHTGGAIELKEAAEGADF